METGHVPPRAMNTNLLSFLTELEAAIQMDDPEPGEGGAWENHRTVNYRLGLAQLSLAVRRPDKQREERGTVELQSYTLAEGTNCLRAQLSWHGQTEIRNHMIYSKPDVDWKREARRVGAEWMSGPRNPVTPSSTDAGLAREVAIA